MPKPPIPFKLAVIGVLMFVLTVMVWLVRDLTHERASRRGEAAQGVAQAHAGPQTLTGPVLFVPYTETWSRPAGADDKGRPRHETVSEERVLTVFPERAETVARLSTETRWRGIFPVTVYVSKQDSSLRFVWPGIAPQQPEGRISLGKAVLGLGVTDLRGLRAAPRLVLGDEVLTVVPTDAGAATSLPLVAAVPTSLLPPVGGQFDLRLEVELAGTGTIAWVPLAGENQVSLSAPWPHPSFGGDFLPSERRISDAGFEARWSVPALSTRARQQFLAPPDKRGALEHLSVSLSDPVDVYRLTDRATKYGSLFILLTFGACFVLEMVRRWRMHPMQYLMVGAALVLFFLLVLSLSERWGFAVAYLTASVACVALVGWYLRHVLGAWLRAAAVGGLLAGLYAALYVILMSEDNALMMGSVLLFGLLAATMAATRRLDWYGVLGDGPASPGRPAKAADGVSPA